MKKSKKTVVLGASPNPTRYSHRAITRLRAAGHEVEAIGLRDGEVSGVAIQKGEPEIDDVDTVTLYVGPQNQMIYADYIEKLKPNRVIFNPGTEGALLTHLEQKGIELIEACTLVMLSLEMY